MASSDSQGTSSSSQNGTTGGMRTAVVAPDVSMDRFATADELITGTDNMRIESVDLDNINDGENSAQQTAAAAAVVSPSVTPSRNHLHYDSNNQQNLREFDDIKVSGSPANPIPFARPKFGRGRRASVCLYDPTTQRLEQANNVLFLDDLQKIKRAYRAIPDKGNIPTIMGHVEICHVLTRCTKGQGDDDDDDDTDDDDDDDDDEDDDDLVFQMTNEFVAIKVNYTDRMDRLRNRHAEDPLKEISAMQLIGNDHPNVLGCIEILFDGKNLNVVLPFCDSGDLFSFLQDQREIYPDKPGLSEGQARFWFRQLIAGLQHLQKRGICHRDISPENIMMNTSSNCLIIDMGMCIRIPYSSAVAGDQRVIRNNNDNNELTEITATAVTDITRGTKRRLIKPQGACGKLPYMSPEIYRNRDPFDGHAVDIWTAGTILFCLLTGNKSYDKPYDTDGQFYWMTRGLEKLLESWEVQLSDEGVDLLKGMLQVKPRLRYTLNEIMNHQWFKHPDEVPDNRRNNSMSWS